MIIKYSERINEDMSYKKIIEGIKESEKYDFVYAKIGTETLTNKKTFICKGIKRDKIALYTADVLDHDKQVVDEIIEADMGDEDVDKWILDVEKDIVETASDESYTMDEAVELIRKYVYILDMLVEYRKNKN